MWQNYNQNQASFGGYPPKLINVKYKLHPTTT